MTEKDGVGATAKLLGWPHKRLQRLMRTPGRAPKEEHLGDLARVSGTSIEEVRRIFGPWRRAIDIRTAATLAVVRQRFPDDPVRIAVVNSIEGEHRSIRAYAAALHIAEETIRPWLTGRHKNLTKRLLQTIIKREGLRLGARWIHAHSAEPHRHSRMARLLRKRWRRKHPRLSDHHRKALAASRRAMWADQAWRVGTGRRLIAAMRDGWQHAWVGEERYLAYLIRLAVGKSRSQHPTGAKPADALRVLCRIALQHRRRFPQSPLKFEDLPRKIATVMNIPLHAILRISGRPYDVKKIAALIRVLAESPPQVWREAGKRLYRDRDKAEVVRDLWHQTRDALPPALLRRLVEVVLGMSVSPTRVEAVLHRSLGRPAQNPLAPV